MTNLFEINFFDKMVTLLKEAFKFKKYKAMPAALAVFAGLLMLPLVVLSFLVTAVLSVVIFLFNVLMAPVKYLHSVVKNEGKEVMHATQFIIYFISWPFTFSMYALLYFLLFLIYPLYALLSIMTYTWSLCGFRFHLFPTEENIGIEVQGRYKVIPWVFVFVGWVSTIVLTIPAVGGIIKYVELFIDFKEAEFPAYGLPLIGVAIAVVLLFAPLFSLIGFYRHPRAPKAPVEPIDETPAAEDVPVAEEAPVAETTTFNFG